MSVMYPHYSGHMTCDIIITMETNGYYTNSVVSITKVPIN